MTYKNVTINLFILAFIGLALWSTFLSYRPEVKSTVINSGLPDAFMDNVHAEVMDKDGKLKMKIVAPRMIHYPDNNATRLISPQLTLYRKSPFPWFITSKFALATQGADNIEFWDDVTIHHPADQTNPATLIKTIKLMVHTNKQIAETAELITLLQPNFKVQAKGMHADMNSGNINLLSQARGEYVPS